MMTLVPLLVFAVSLVCCMRAAHAGAARPFPWFAASEDPARDIAGRAVRNDVVWRAQ